MFNFHIYKISMSVLFAVALAFQQSALQSSWAAEVSASPASENDPASIFAAPVNASAAPVDSVSKDAVPVEAQKPATESSPPASPASGPNNVTSKKLYREEVQKFASPAIDQQIDQLVDEAVAQAENQK